MADYSELKAAIRAAIYDNVSQAITGDKLQEILLEMVDELGQSYVKPAGGIPASDIASGVIPDVSQFITKTVNDLVNYYKKTETYTQQEVNNLIGAISQFHYEIYASLEAITDPASNVLYLIGPSGSGADRYEEYVYASDVFTKIGDTSIDLSEYLKYTAQTLTDVQKQQARTNIGATAPEIFWATYGTTTAQQVKDAVNANKEVLCVDGALIYQLSDNGTEYIYFSCLRTGTTANVLRLKVSDDSWIRGGQTTLENTANKVTALSASSTDTQYPSAKCVYKALATKQNVISSSNKLDYSLIANVPQDATPVSQSDQQFTFRQTAGGAKPGASLAKVTEVRGKSLVWNQKVPVYTATATTYRGLTLTPISTGVYTISGTSDGSGNIVFQADGGKFVSGHKYFFGYYSVTAEIDGVATNQLRLFLRDIDNNVTVGPLYPNSTETAIIATASSAGTIYVYLNFAASVAISGTLSPMVIDLTLMFGAGNEPTTVAEFEALYPLPYYAYNAGTLLNNKVATLETVGFNQWDEEWELGQYHPNTGETMSSSTNIRSKNYIPVLPGRAYYFKTPSQLRICQYDGSKNFISIITGGANNVAVTLDGQARFIMICTTNGATTTYNHDICINLSDTAKNGTYEPYEKHTLTLNLPTLTGKLNGEGSSVTIAADGLKSAGSAYDYGVVENGFLTKIVKCIGSVDMGTLTWTYASAQACLYSTQDIGQKRVTGVTSICEKYPSIANVAGSAQITDDKVVCLGSVTTEYRVYVKDSTYTDGPTFKTAMDGVYLYYELAEPLTYILDTPIPVTYFVNDLGTESITPTGVDANGVPNTAPLRASLQYGLTEGEMYGNLQAQSLPLAAFQAFLTALGTQMNGTWAMTENDGQYSFTFTPD